MKHPASNSAIYTDQRKTSAAAQSINSSELFDVTCSVAWGPG